MTRKLILIFLTSLLLGCGSHEKNSSFVGLGDPPNAFHQKYGKETRKNKPSVLHESFSMDEYYDVNEYRYRVSYMDDSAELITVLRIDGNPMSDTELNDLLTEFSGTKQWHHQGNYPDGGKIWQRDDAAAAKYSPNAQHPCLELHEQGVTGGKVSAGATPLSRSELSRLVADYQDNFAVDGGVSATYETAAFLLSK